MKKTAFLLAILAIFAVAGKGIYSLKKGYSPRRIAAPLHMELLFWNEEANQAIDQPFRFLARGRQCFVFESQDGKYVLKLLRTDLFQIPFRFRAFPFTSKKREKTGEKRRKKEEFILNSMRIAYEELSEETGVVALHLGQTDRIGKHLSIRDPLGFTYHLPADKTPFILQAKHPLLMEAFLETADLPRQKEILEALIAVVVSRGNKGIANRDESFLPNYGFDGKNGYQIDIGCFYRRNDSISCIRDTLRPVREWLEIHAPTLLTHFDQTLEIRLYRNSRSQIHSH